MSSLEARIDRLESLDPLVAVPLLLPRLQDPEAPVRARADGQTVAPLRGGLGSAR